MGAQVTASHTCAMGSYDNAYCSKLFRLLKASGINFISCPTESIHLQGRFDTWPKRRGVTRVAELDRAGINVSYRIAGEGPEREKLTFMIDQLGLTHAVKLLGVCTEAQVRHELADADVLLLPSLSEGISNAALEAMAAGRVVVTTDCGGMTEVVSDGLDGFVVAVGDTAAMADTLTRLSGDPQLRNEVARRAGATADQHLDISRQVRVFVDAYRRLSA